MIIWMMYMIDMDDVYDHMDVHDWMMYMIIWMYDHM